MNKKEKEKFLIILAIAAIFVGLVAIPSEIYKPYSIPPKLLTILSIVGIGSAVYALLIMPSQAFVKYLKGRLITIEDVPRPLEYDELEWALEYTKSILPDFAP